MAFAALRSTAANGRYGLLASRPRTRVVRQASHTPERGEPRWEIHGRHVDVDEHMRQTVIDRCVREAQAVDLPRVRSAKRPLAAVGCAGWRRWCTSCRRDPSSSWR